MEVHEMSRDLMVGATTIANYLGVRKRQVYHAAEHGYLPLFRMGSLICGRRTTLARWVEEQERSTAPVGPGNTPVS